MPMKTAKYVKTVKIVATVVFVATLIILVVGLGVVFREPEPWSQDEVNIEYDPETDTSQYVFVRTYSKYVFGRDFSIKPIVLQAYSDDGLLWDFKKDGGEYFCRVVGDKLIVASITPINGKAKYIHVKCESDIRYATQPIFFTILVAAVAPFLGIVSVPFALAMSLYRKEYVYEDNKIELYVGLSRYYVRINGEIVADVKSSCARARRKLVEITTETGDSIKVQFIPHKNAIVSVNDEILI